MGRRAHAMTVAAVAGVIERIEASVRRSHHNFPRSRAARVAKAHAVLMFHAEVEGIFAAAINPERPLMEAGRRLNAALGLIKAGVGRPYASKMLGTHAENDDWQDGRNGPGGDDTRREPTRLEAETAQLYRFIYGLRWEMERERYVEEAGDLLRRRLTLNGMRLQWFRNKVCLDAGCGLGRTTWALHSLGPRLTVGVDYGSADSLKCACELGRGGAYIPVFARANLEELPFADRTFDFVLCQGVLHHMRNPGRGVEEIYRVLRTGGRVWLLVYGKNLYQRALDISRCLLTDVPYELFCDIMLRMGCRIGLINNFLDNLFVPIKASFRASELEDLLRSVGFRKIVRHRREVATGHHTPATERVFRREPFARLKFGDGDFRYLAMK